MSSAPRHIPVMLNEVLQTLAPKDGEVYVDATFGNGGYTAAILQAADCRLIALDRDPSVLPRVNELKARYGERFDFKSGTFGELSSLISEKISAVFLLLKSLTGFSGSVTRQSDARPIGVNVSPSRDGLSSSPASKKTISVSPFSSDFKSASRSSLLFG